MRQVIDSLKRDLRFWVSKKDIGRRSQVSQIPGTRNLNVWQNGFLRDGMISRSRFKNRLRRWIRWSLLEVGGTVRRAECRRRSGLMSTDDILSCRFDVSSLCYCWNVCVFILIEYSCSWLLIKEFIAKNVVVNKRTPHPAPIQVSCWHHWCLGSSRWCMHERFETDGWAERCLETCTRLITVTASMLSQALSASHQQVM